MMGAKSRTQGLRAPVTGIAFHSMREAHRWIEQCVVLAEKLPTILRDLDLRDEITYCQGLLDRLEKLAAKRRTRK